MIAVLICGGSAQPTLEEVPNATTLVGKGQSQPGPREVIRLRWLGVTGLADHPAGLI